jgi:hypothetical protein
MVIENGVISIVISSSVVVGFFAYVINSVWKGYLEFRKHVYENMITKERCKEIRDLEAGRPKNG